MEAMSTPPQLIQLALGFLSEPTNPPPLITAPPSDLLQSQLEIGWVQFLCACISRKWHSAYNSLAQMKQKVNLLIWTAHFIQSIWCYLHSLWKHRNHVLHNQQGQKQSSVTLTKLCSKTTEFYNRYSSDPHMIPEYLRYLFKHPIGVMHQLSEDALRCWVDTIEEASRIQENLQQASKGSIRCLYRFLGRDPPAKLELEQPTNITVGDTPTNQDEPRPRGSQLKPSKPRPRRRHRRAKVAPISEGYQTTLRRYGFQKKECLSSSHSQADANSQKSDFSGTWLSTTP
jgi:hypothetical protein